MIDARIGGNGVSAPHLTARSLVDRVAMIDNWLVDHNLMFVEVNRDDPRPWEERVADRDVIEFLRVGVTDEHGAAEYVRNDLTSAHCTIRSTIASTPHSATPSVPYGDGRNFPTETITSRAEVRQLMIDFVATGEWPNTIPSRNHTHLIA